jgi:hypothetical protein
MCILSQLDVMVAVRESNMNLYIILITTSAQYTLNISSITAEESMAPFITLIAV